MIDTIPPLIIAKMVEEMNFGKALRCMVSLHQLISWFEFLLTLKACQNGAFKGCVFVLNVSILNKEILELCNLSKRNEARCRVCVKNRQQLNCIVSACICTQPPFRILHPTFVVQRRTIS